jgi:hypothetical protein
MPENRSPITRLDALLRSDIAIVAMVILFLEYASYKITLAINAFYFKIPHASLGGSDYFWLALAIYLFLVAASGRRVLFRKGS